MKILVTGTTVERRPVKTGITVTPTSVGMSSLLEKTNIISKLHILSKKYQGISIL